MSVGKVVLVTGCTDGGIGSGLCKEFHARGCRVFATARRVEAMGELAALGMRTLPLDVTSPSSVKAAVEAVAAETGGRIDILINNAGVGLVAPLAEVDIEAAKKLFDANVWGLLAVTQAVVPYMAAVRRGTVVNVGSVVGFFATPWAGVYSASKAAVHSMSEALRLELAPFGIRVVLVAPGAIRSNIGANNEKSFDDKRIRLYLPFLPVLRARTQLSQSPKSTPTDVFARKVANQVLRRSPPRVFMYGHMVGAVRFALRLPLWLRDRMLARKFSLNTRLPLPAPEPSAAPAIEGEGERQPLAAAGDKKSA